MNEPPRVLISACLAGVPCRYDGQAQTLDALERLARVCALIPVCPEQLGGLPTPRAPAERVGGRVVNRDGADVTAAFQRGADQTRRLAGLCGARLALLKSRSPSCGKGFVYDGRFRGQLVPGDGLAARALLDLGIPVYTEQELDALLSKLEAMNRDTL